MCRESRSLDGLLLASTTFLPSRLQDERLSLLQVRATAGLNLALPWFSSLQGSGRQRLPARFFLRQVFDFLCSAESFPLLHPQFTHHRIPAIPKLDRYLRTTTTN